MWGKVRRTRKRVQVPGRVPDGLASDMAASVFGSALTGCVPGVEAFVTYTGCTQPRNPTQDEISENCRYVCRWFWEINNRKTMSQRSIC